MRRFTCILLFVFALSLIGCGGGGSDAGPGLVTSEADQLLASQILGTWKLSQATKNGALVPVRSNSAGQVGTITFKSDNTASSVDYTISTSNTVAVGNVPIDNNFYQTKDEPATLSGGTYTVSGGKLYSTTPSGQTYTNTVEIKNGELYQTMSDGEVRVWVK